MNTPDWKLIAYHLNSRGFSLDIKGETLFIVDGETGESAAFPWAYSKRCEPSILAKLSGLAARTILITDRVPLEAAHRLTSAYRGYIDLLGNFDFPLGKRRYSHRVSRSLLRSSKKPADFFAPSSYAGGKILRALLASEEPLTLRTLSSKTGLSLGAVSEGCTYFRSALSLKSQEDLWLKETKTRLLGAWKEHYRKERVDRFLCFGDPAFLVHAIEVKELPFLLIGGDYALNHFGKGITHPSLTLCTAGPIPEGFLHQFGLISDPKGNVVIRKASAYAIREMQEAYVDEIEAYLTSGLPESPNSAQ